ncbi:MAG: protein kinase [Planctomycetes bacterium]|nr:protein kinase [Planctomycetota bacterium]
MTESRSGELERILAELETLDPEERTYRLDRLEREDPRLHRALSALVTADSSGRTFLGPAGERSGVRATDTLDRTELAPGMRIGPCRLERLLGEGGMGAVYEARQDGLDRPVAVKVMKGGIILKAARARFLHEARLLSRLRHPGIAQVFEFGLHDLGPEQPSLPYYVLELVPGARALDRWVREEEPEAEALVELFIAVAEAVAHGHRLGVIHRDLKPGNILVDAEGRPKVIDFGLARAEDDDLVSRSFATESGALVGTLPYMSPEQLASASDLDTRSDLYSLGVILFELLAGQRPHELRGKSLPEAMRTLRELPAPRLRRFRPEIPADLETICLKTLRKAPDDRYPSVDALIEDLRRWRKGLPILARPQSAVYALRLFARRNKAVVVLGLVIFILLVGSSVVSLRYARRASEAARRERSRREQAERLLAASTSLADWLVLDHLDQLARLPGATRSAEETTTRILAWLEAMAADAGDDDDLERSLALAELEVGSVLGSPSRPNLGRRAPARERILAAERRLEARLDRRPADFDRLVDLVVARSTRAEIEVDLGRLDEAEAAFDAVDALIGGARDRQVDDPRLGHIEAQLLRDRAWLVGRRGRPAEGLELARRGVALRRSLIEAKRIPKGMDVERALVVDRMTELSLLADLGRGEEAAALATELIDRLRAIRRPDDPILANDLAFALTQRADGLCRDPAGLVEAEQLYAEARDLRRDLLAHDPEDSARLGALALAEERWALALVYRNERLPEALASFREAESILRRAGERAPESLDLRSQLRIVLGHVVGVANLTGDRELARQAASEALELARNLVAARPEDLGGRRALAESCTGMALVEISSLRPEDDLESQREAIRRALHWFREGREVFRALESLAERPSWLDANLAAQDRYIAVCEQNLAQLED